jgi:hypothetical protein
MMGRSIQPAIYSHARLATICAISADSGLIRKLRKSFCLGSQYHSTLPGRGSAGMIAGLSGKVRHVIRLTPDLHLQMR